jgi:hypothetical protein
MPTFNALVTVWLLLLLHAIAVSSAAAQQQPRNIIILIADGAAPTQWDFGRYSSKVLRQQPFVTTDVLFRQGALGLLTTSPGSSKASSYDRLERLLERKCGHPLAHGSPPSRRLPGGVDAAERRSVWRATADRIVHVVQHEQVLIGARSGHASHQPCEQQTTPG